MRQEKTFVFIGNGGSLNMSHLRLVAVAVHVFVSFLCLQNVALCGVTGDLELLKLVAGGQAANRERIVTWKGRATIVQSRTDTVDGTSSTMYSTSFADFACDSKLSAKRFVMYHLQDTKQPVLPTTQLREIFAIPFVSGLQKGKEVYRFRQSVAPDKSFARACTLGDAAETPFEQKSPDDFDPFTWYASRKDELDVMGKYETYRSWADIASVSISVTRTGDLVSVQDTLGPVTVTWTYDLSKGGNLVSLDNTMPGEHYAYAVEYEAAGDAWVPAKVVRIQQNSRINIRRDIAFENEIGVPLSDSDFTLDAIGMKTGDVIQDTRTALRYAYKGQDRLQPKIPGESSILSDITRPFQTTDSISEVHSDTVGAQEFPTGTQPQPSPRSFSAWVVALCAAILIAVIAILVIRSRKS